MATFSALSYFAGCFFAGRLDLITHKLATKFRGIDLAHVSVSELGLSDEKAHWYSDSGGPDLRRVLKALRIPRRATAIDIGSGKGGAVITLSHYLYTEVWGLELSSPLIAIAQENARRAGVVANFVHGDASTFTDIDRFDLVYMYNPFPAAVMEAFLRNVRASLQRTPRPVTLIYKNPTAHETILASGCVRHLRDYTFKKCHHPFAVYQSYQ